MRLIFIHGRAQQGKDSETLKTLWVETLKKGLQKSNLQLPENVEILFPFYGDLLDQLTKSSENTDDLKNVIARGTEGDKMSLFIHDILWEIAENARISSEDILKNYNGFYHERGPLNWEWIQSILKTLDEKTSFGSYVIRKFTYDVFTYLTRTGIRSAVNNHILKQIGNENCVVVGHSLGSIIGYNILKEATAMQVKKYITVGSPLGLKAIRSRLDVPLCMPSCIKAGWFNAYDDRDYIAINPLNEKYFNISPAIKNKNDVINSTDNRHGIEGYLDDSEVAKVIYEALLIADKKI